ncbi:LysR substrate-binding domain-containing protein [Rhodospirillum sp. A1_3_36]|uniref:LysR substrate-binding domain-containing protein n=1 Tax=Rhodospirillum sp. A1_3_36 TaxID=3391666 RepID=UPI0039A493EC
MGDGEPHSRGILRVTAPVSFGAEKLVPALGTYRDRAPDVTLDILLTDRRVDLVEEGVDVAFRIGTIADGPVIARPLSPYRMIICAAPAYLARKGIPRHPKDLAGHEAVGFTPSAASPWRLSRGRDEEEVVTVTPAMPVVVNSGQAVRQAGLAGLGVILQPALLLEADIQAGLLVPILEDWCLPSRPMSLLYYRDRTMTPRLRSFLTFAVDAFGAPSSSKTL